MLFGMTFVGVVAARFVKFDALPARFVKFYALPARFVTPAHFVTTW